MLRTPAVPRSRRARATFVAGVVAGAVVVGCVALPAAAAGRPAQPATPAPDELVLHGRGHGHGVGMTHDGALELARRGRSTEQILQVFYPGARLRRGGGTVRVLLREVVAPGPVTVRLPAGGSLRADSGTAPGLPRRVTAGQVVRVSARDGRISATADDVAVATPGALLVVPETVAGLVDGTQHRGLLRFVVRDGRLRVVAHLDVEDYLRGMGEVRDSSWPPAALGAQAVAARTYALHATRHRELSADFDLFKDDRSQVYLGAQAEYAAMDGAVSATAGRVLRFDGRLVNALYSTNGGGVTATPVEGFGPTRLRAPYLASVRYPSADPAPWTFRMRLGDVARRIGYPGRITSFRVAQTGPSGRALGVEVDGTRGRRALAGTAIAEHLGLRSTLFAVVRPAVPAAPAVNVATRSTVVRGLDPAIAMTAPAPAAARPLGPSTSERRIASGVACTLVAGVLTGLLGHVGEGVRRPRRGLCPST